MVGKQFTKLLLLTNPSILLVSESNQDFMDAVNACISYVITTQAGGNMVISAGLVPALVGALSVKDPRQLKVLPCNLPPVMQSANKEGLNRMLQRLLGYWIVSCMGLGILSHHSRTQMVSPC